jgi:hypothetical protein
MSKPTETNGNDPTEPSNENLADNTNSDTHNSQNENHKNASPFRLISQNQMVQYRKYQDVAKGITFESITINELVCEVNRKIENITRRRLILDNKRAIVG